MNTHSAAARSSQTPFRTGGSYVTWKALLSVQLTLVVIALTVLGFLFTAVTARINRQEQRSQKQFEQLDEKLDRVLERK